MRKFVITLFIIIIMGSLLMSACATSNSNAENALTTLLNCNNYKSEWFFERRLNEEGKMKEFNGNYSLIAFHKPYKSKESFVYDHPNQEGIISGDFYEIKKGDSYKHKLIYMLESNDTKELEMDRSFSEEWLITQIKSCLLSEEFVGEQNIDGISVKKYKISVTAYPFIIYFGFSFDKNDFKTRIFLREYKECEGYVYINSKTSYIQKIEFDLSEKMALNKKIAERINELGERSFTMLDYEKFKISIVISNINDDSKDIKDIEKEIDRVMQ